MGSFVVLLITTAETNLHHCTCSDRSDPTRVFSADVVKKSLSNAKTIIGKHFDQSYFNLVTWWYTSWCGIQTPWNPLDDDGNEEEFEDIVSLNLISAVSLSQLTLFTNWQVSDDWALGFHLSTARVPLHSPVSSHFDLTWCRFHTFATRRSTSRRFFVSISQPPAKKKFKGFCQPMVSTTCLRGDRTVMKSLAN